MQCHGNSIAVLVLALWEVRRKLQLIPTLRPNRWKIAGTPQFGVHQAGDESELMDLAATVACELAIALFHDPSLDRDDERERRDAKDPVKFFTSLGKAMNCAAVVKNLRAAADILEARPIEAPINADGTRNEDGAHGLRPADPNDFAAWMRIIGFVAEFPNPEGQAVEVPEAWLRKALEELPADERLKRMRQFGATGDDTTLRRSLKRMIGAKFKPGRPAKKSGK